MKDLNITCIVFVYYLLPKLKCIDQSYWANPSWGLTKRNFLKEYLPLYMGIAALQGSADIILQDDMSADPTQSLLFLGLRDA